MAIAIVPISAADLAALEKALEGVRGGTGKAIDYAVRRTVTGVRTVVVRSAARRINVEREKLFEKGNKRRPVRELYTRSGGLVVGGEVVVSGGLEQRTFFAIAGKGRIPLGRFDPMQTWRDKKLKRPARLHMAGSWSAWRDEATTGGSMRATGKKRAGVRYKLMRGGRRSFIKGERMGPFVAKMKSGYVGVWRRLPSGRLAQLWGPSVYWAVRGDGEVQGLMAGGANTTFRRQLEQRVAHLVARGNRSWKELRAASSGGGGEVSGG